MHQKFLKHINSKFPFLKDKKLFIAISGGVDSVVLTHLIVTLNAVEVSLAHCNFQLRGRESDLDEEFVINLGKELHVKTFTTQFETNQFAQQTKVSTQIAARNLRYNWFKELVQKHKFDYVLTAHHADDNLETFLINLSRGTGLEGLTGIPEINGNILRPLLPFSRDEILDYATKNSIYWREDQSNASTKYIRNKIRHNIVPILKEINPSLLDSFAKTTTHLLESQQIINDKVSEISKEIIQKDFSTKTDVKAYNIKKIKALSNPKAYLYQLLKNYNFTEWNDIYNLLFAQSGKQIFSKTHILLKDRDFLLLSEKETTNSSEFIFKIDKNTSEIKHPIRLSFKETDYLSEQNSQSIYIDNNKIQFPLQLRKWKNGDVFYPSGMQGKKKISKYFKDEKFSLIDKENTWLLCNNDDSIIWIVGHRSDNRFIAKSRTKSFLKVTIIN